MHIYKLMDIEYERLYLKYKKKYLELKQSGGSLTEEQQAGLDEILNYLGGEPRIGGRTLLVKILNYLAGSPGEDDLFKQIKVLEDQNEPLTSEQAQERINKMSKFKERTGLSYKAANAYIGTEDDRQDAFRESTKDYIYFKGGLDVDLIPMAIEKKKTVDAAAKRKRETEEAEAAAAAKVKLETEEAEAAAAAKVKLEREEAAASAAKAKREEGNSSTIYMLEEILAEILVVKDMLNK